ncbi:MAG: energy transducer TonB [Alistipes sp.]|jgi:TonB family protein|nr:energy transducer TonB [Alistipes sp.]MBQ5395322.1 energy transducer TonB [Alistipes sp.]MBQ5396460.1 energy transducer TonB [Alistipes sp.]
MRLPFDDRKQDAGEWAYDHRIGLSMMVIVYLILGIAFFASKIVIGSRPHMQGIYVDLQTLAELEAEKERLEREIELKQQDDIDWSAVRNRMSNDALLNENLRDDRGTNTSEINESARDIAAGMAANRAAYEAGMAEAQSILDAERAKPSDSDKSSKGQDAKYKGGVTVRYSFKDPVRTKRDLVIPAYKCEAGGQVEVAVVLDQGGEVISARVISGGDERMREEALKAARASLFNIDNTAPARHSGTITYTFIPQ